MKGVLNFLALETLAVKRRPLSHSKSLVRRETLVMVPIDKDLLGEGAAIDKLERTKFDQARMIKEM